MHVICQQRCQATAVVLTTVFSTEHAHVTYIENSPIKETCPLNLSHFPIMYIILYVDLTYSPSYTLCSIEKQTTREG